VLEDQIGFLLRCAHQRASARFAAVMAPFGLTPTQFAALARLLADGPLPQNELGRRIAMDPASIFAVAARLVARGLLMQDADADDGRRVILRLTPEGEALARAMVAEAPSVSRETLRPLSAREARTLCALLRRLG
jgi:DNA-binding MarR family transcriptional regulator